METIIDADASSWFSKTVEGLTYTANASANGSTITVTVTGLPVIPSSDSFDITIPSGVIQDNRNNVYNFDLEVSGSIKYNINEDQSEFERTRYIAVPDSIPLDMISFRDDDYYYYMFKLGEMQAVPLQDNATVIRYSGNAPSLTFTTTTTTATTVEETTTHATSVTEGQYHEASVKVTATAEAGALIAKTSLSVEAGYTGGWNKDETETWENSYSTAETYSQENSTSATYTIDDDYELGYYRYILLGDLDVYTLVIYDPKTEEYTFKTISDVTEQYWDLDYSPNSRFDDQIPQELPFDVSLLNDLNWKPTDYISPDDLPVDDLPLVTTYTQVLSPSNGIGGRDRWITHDDGQWDYFTTNFDIDRLKAAGYKTMRIYVKFGCKESSDGYQEMWIYKYHGAGSLWHYAKYDHGGTGTSGWWDESTTKDVGIDNWDLDNKFSIQWGAQGSGSDSWWLGTTTVTVTALK
jgi:hypothetical protein